MTKTFCDICGKELTRPDKIFYAIIKKRVYSWHEYWWEKLDAHEECWKDLCELITQKQEENYK